MDCCFLPKTRPLGSYNMCFSWHATVIHGCGDGRRGSDDADLLLCPCRVWRLKVTHQKRILPPRQNKPSPLASTTWMVSSHADDALFHRRKSLPLSLQVDAIALIWKSKVNSFLSYHINQTFQKTWPMNLTLRARWLRLDLVESFNGCICGTWWAFHGRGATKAYQQFETTKSKLCFSGRGIQDAVWLLVSQDSLVFPLEYAARSFFLNRCVLPVQVLN